MWEAWRQYSSIIQTKSIPLHSSIHIKLHFKHRRFFFLMGYTHKEVQVRKCPEQGSYLKFKDERNNLAGDFNCNTANTTKPLSVQFHLPHSFTAGSSSTALPKVKLGKKNLNWTDWHRAAHSHSPCPMQSSTSSAITAAQAKFYYCSINKKQPCSSP